MAAVSSRRLRSNSRTLPRHSHWASITNYTKLLIDSSEADAGSESCHFPGMPSEWPVVFPELFHPWISCNGQTTISGIVEFWNCLKPIRQNVPFTTLTLNTSDVPETLVETVINNDATGRYTFNVSPFNSYQLGSPNGPDGVFRADAANDFGVQGGGGTTDIRNAISAADVGMIMLYWNDPAGFPLKDCGFDTGPYCGDVTIYPQRVAADVNAWLTEVCPSGATKPSTASSTSQINGVDASILQQVIAARMLGGMVMPEGYPIFEPNKPSVSDDDNEDCFSNWRFFCANKSFGIIPVGGVEYNPIGVLIGDVNGSYTNDPTVPRKPAVNASLAIPVVVSKEKRVIVPVELNDAESILGVEAKILYDKEALRFVGASAPISMNTDAPTNHAWGVSNDDGAVALIVTGLTQPLDGSSTVALLEFERVNPTETKATSPILIVDAHADDAEMKTDPGFFTSTGVRNTTWGDVKKLFR